MRRKRIHNTVVLLHIFQALYTELCIYTREKDFVCAITIFSDLDDDCTAVEYKGHIIECKQLKTTTANKQTEKKNIKRTNTTRAAIRDYKFQLVKVFFIRFV